MTLTLTANSPEEAVIKEYLEQHASEGLAEKINHGVTVEKDGKQLISRKTLAGFMGYAAEEAKQQAGKGASCACVQDAVVFGWAIHYFEEDSIIGTLYNEDGSEYVKPKPVTKTQKKKNLATTQPPAPQSGQMSLFDFTDEPTEEVDEEPVEEPMEQPMEQPPASFTVDTATGEVIGDIKPDTDTDPYADEELLCKIFDLLDRKIEIVR